MSQRFCQDEASLPVGDLADYFKLQIPGDEVSDGDDELVMTESSSDDDETDNEKALLVEKDSDDVIL